MKSSKDSFKFKAVIDYVEIRFKTLKPTNGGSVKRNTGLAYVDPLNKSEGSAATEFSAKLHDIEKWSEVDAIYNNIKSVYDLESDPRIFAVEVSFDAYTKGADFDEMIDYLVEFGKNLANPVSENRRFTRGKKGTTIAWGDPSKTILRLKRGGSLYIGNNNGSTKMLIYYKNIDKNKPLPESQHRARVEITLRDQDCPFSSLEEAKDYNFTKLTEYFRLRKSRDDLIGLDKIVALRTPQIGERKLRHRIGGGSRLHSRLTVADTEMNQIIYDQLRYLTKRLNTPVRILR